MIYFLKRPCKDIDIVAIGSGIELAKSVSKKLGSNYPVTFLKNFGTAHIKYHDYDIEFVGARKESYRNGRASLLLKMIGTLVDDQNRRDFTINALAISLANSSYGKMIDPFNGYEDLQRQLIKTPLDPDITFSDDPLRMLRAIRFSSQLNFVIDKDALTSIAKNKERIKIVSADITDELNKIILSPQPSIGFKLLFDTGLLHIVFPLMANLQGVETINKKSHKDNFYHTLKYSTIFRNTAMRC